MATDVLFWPYDDKKPLSRQYPELGRREEFRLLKNHEQEFVWLYACKSSYLMKDLGHDKKARAKKAFEITYKGLHFDERKYAEFSALMFPADIKAAIEVMSKFSPEYRSRALEGINSAFESCLEVLNTPIPQTKKEIIENPETGEPEEFETPLKPTDIKNYIEAKKTAQLQLPDLLAKIEEGFGIVSVDDGIEDVPTITRFIREKRLKRTA